MSINVYFNEKISGHSGFKKIEKTANKGEKYESFSLLGSSLYYEKGQYHMIYHSPTESIPESLLEYVDEISFYETLPGMPTRERGIYRLRSAEAELEDSKYEKCEYGVKIRAKKMEDILELFRMIQTGTIRPDESFEYEQTGFSCAETMADLFRVLDEAARLRHANEHCFTISEGYRQGCDARDERMRRALNFIHMLRGESLGFRTSRKQIIGTLWEILSPGLMDYYPGK